MLIELVLAMGGLANAGGVFISEKHPTSQRSAIFEETADVAYLYLTAPNTIRPEGDAIVYSTGKLTTPEEAKRVAEDGGPPPLAKSVASSEAVVRGVNEDQISFKWTSKGDGVAVLRHGKPVAMVIFVEGRVKGYSRALLKASFYGEPWDQATFENRFSR